MSNLTWDSPYDNLSFDGIVSWYCWHVGHISLMGRWFDTD